MFDFYKTVLTLHDESIYVSAMGKSYNVSTKGRKRDKGGKTSYYKTYWRTHQMSDHLPMWIELKTDFGKEYLEGKAAGEAALSSKTKSSKKKSSKTRSSKTKSSKKKSSKTKVGPA